MANPMIDKQAKVYQDFINRFPLCFKRKGCCMEFGLQHGEGWNPIIENLLTKIEARLVDAGELGINSEHGFAIDQVKEKFGTLRFYVTGADDGIFDWIDEAEALSARTCEVCGKTGSLQIGNGRYWVRTLCPECAEKLNYRPYDKDRDDI